MAYDLLERDQYLCRLDEALRQAAVGHGQFVLVSGEAGIGKTSLVERFLEGCPPGTRTRWGACEALFTPRPLGPLYDIAQQTQAPLRTLLDSEANRATLFGAVLDDLTQGPTPTVVVIEDIHWADEATLDLIKYLARRIHRIPTLLIVTYRDDELSRDHPLRLVLGDLPTRSVTRLRLPPLSEAAVAALAQHTDRRVEELYFATGGNPFFLNEVLASDASGAPTSVSDAVLAQISRRSPEAQRLLELVAVVPHRIEWWAIEALSAGQSDTLEECLVAGLLRQEGDAVGYRHELARQAVEGALAPARRRTLHGEVLRVLLERDEQTSLARLVHHAVQAENCALALRFAPAAARQASAQGAHREAAAHYATALRYADNVDAEQRAALLDGLSHERYLTGRMEDAIEPCETALAIWRALGRTEEVGRTLRRLSRLSWFLDRHAEAERRGMEAVEVLGTLRPSRELAMAYANMAHLGLLWSDPANAVAWGQRAIDLAERLHDYETLSYALNTIGSAQLNEGDEGGRAKLERSLTLALEYEYEEHVARAYANLADELVRRREYPQAVRLIEDGIAYCAARDLGNSEYCVQGHRARTRLDQGDWVGAEEDATAILSVPWASGSNRLPALIVLCQVRVRRGDPGIEALLQEASDLALISGNPNCFIPISAVRAEWRWLQGCPEQCLTEARAGLEKAFRCDISCFAFEVMFWLWRGGGLTDVPPWMLQPFALQMTGDWQAAAAEWERRSCPYEQALALLDGDEPAQRTALGIFECLGAAPAAEITRQRLRAAGARGLPRGPRPTTQANPHGLTNRQLEVLLLLAEGLRNTEIAERLSTTPKTVEHHISAVLAKLEARSRAEAVRVAYQVGLIPQTAGAGSL